MTCQNGGFDSDGVRHCEIRERTVPAIGRLTWMRIGTAASR
jgi:hypothetical protein